MAAATGAEASGQAASEPLSGTVLKWGSAAVLRGGTDLLLVDLMVFLTASEDREATLELVGTAWQLGRRRRASDTSRRIRGLFDRLARLDRPAA